MFAPVSTNEFFMPTQQMQMFAPRYGRMYENPMMDPFFGPLFMDPEEAAASLKVFMELGYGFGKGFATRNNLTQVEACVADASKLEAQIDEILEDVKKLSPENIIKAAKDLIALVKELPSDLKQCENMKDDVKRVHAWVKNVVTHPSTILKNAIAHIGDLTKEAKKEMDDLKADKGVEAGDDLAQIVVDLFGTVDQEWQPEADLTLF